MDSRRSFLKKSILASGAIGVSQFMPLSIQKALAINPAPGSTYLDAEHIVFLMQENRSFDHAYGTLRGVRGFNDPRAVKFPGKNIAWLQSNRAGETYSPFRLDIKDTKITWMGSLPHGRQSQMLARNDGKYDKWLEAKKPGEKEYAKMPLTMGHYTREDIPFYYALADAFTVCDQNFCSSLTGTDPNRLYFWTGTVREKMEEASRPWVQNDDIEIGVAVPSFPERLEQQGISWKSYQNEISADGGFTEEEDVWLASFGDNVLEFLKQYNVKLSKRYIDYLPKKIIKLQDEIKDLQAKIPTLPAGKETDTAQRRLKERQKELDIATEEEKIYTIEKYESLNEFQKMIHQKAFTVNSKDPHQHQLEPLNYKDGDTDRQINIPKGDLFHQFREDVESGNLPTVSWLTAPEFFSDHPSAPWFGSWYLSEAMDILTKNPEVWKKTIFILAYDENDGYFDHVPPFVAPDPRNPASGKVSAGIDTAVEHVTLQKDSPGSIGLGYRVPLVVASPWTRGGWVNSQVFDHTSSLQFLESFLSKKFGKKIEEPNITQWRRTVCGDLSSVFRPDNGEKIGTLPFLAKDAFIESVHKAKFKNPPNNYKNLAKEEIEQINNQPWASPYMPKQEKGIRDACAIPYELYAEGRLSEDKKNFNVKLKAAKEIFGDRAAGSPFSVYAPVKAANGDIKLWSYGVAAGDELKDTWLLDDFENGMYHLFIHGPNGFFREFKGNALDPVGEIRCAYQTGPIKPGGSVALQIANDEARAIEVVITDNAYKNPSLTKKIDANKSGSVLLGLSKSFGWYDFTVRIKGNTVFEKRYAGHVETGSPSHTDPLMGGVV